MRRSLGRSGIFPEEFCFQITIEELEKVSSRSQFATLNKSNNYRGYNIKYLPYVLTEQGIMMLSGLLKSDIAVKVNVQIIDAFVRMRKYISSNLIEQKYINELVIKDNERINLLEESFSKLEEKGLQIIEKNVMMDKEKNSYIFQGTVLTKEKLESYRATKQLEVPKEEGTVENESE